jgi:putative oxidoreductase
MQGEQAVLYRINEWVGSLVEESRDGAWTLMRVLSSAMFMTHGWSKLFGENPQAAVGSGMTTVNIADLLVFPMPMEINALFLAGVIELFGGGLLLIGLWTHLLALLAAILMLMAYLTAHLAWFPTLNRGELAAMYFLVYWLLFVFGPGPYSADCWLATRRQEKRQSKRDAMESASITSDPDPGH